MSVNIQQFTIYWCNLEPTYGHQMKKTRPCVVISPNEMNNSLSTVIVVPMTSTVRKLPFYMPVTYSKHQGALACDQIETIDKRRVGDQLAPLTSKDSLILTNILHSIFRFNEKS